MNYKLLNVSHFPITKHFVKEVYVLENGEIPNTYACVPNGEIGLSFILRGKSYLKSNDTWVEQPQAALYGLVKQVQFHQMTPNYKEINIGFRPEFLQLFLKDKLAAISKESANNLSDFIQASAVNQLFESLMAAPSNQEILEAIETFVGKTFLQDSLDKRIDYALQKIRQGELKNVETLAQDLNISSTTLRNLFRAHVGISPKELIKIHRIKSVLQHPIEAFENLTQLGYAFGYYDQSHFIHDFKESIGLSPNQYFSNKQLHFDFYNYQRWNLDSFANIKLK